MASPGEGVNVHFGIHLAQDKSDDTGLYLLKAFTPAAGGPTIPADTSRYVTGWSLNPVFARLIGIPDNSTPGLNNANDGADLQADIDLGGAKLTSISAYNRMIRREFDDWDATQYRDSDEFLRTDVDVLSQEAAPRIHGGGPLGWGGRSLLLERDLRGALLSRI